ncbi:Na/Pi cotransporter family protein, partial [Criibacterium bergeronii]
MELSYLIGLLGGLVLFLYGMNLMSQGLELAAGNKMQKIIERFTSNRLSGVLIGTIVTAVIQSSSATTVMVVGFVNANLMTLGQAVGVIMGANIGTTVTGQLVALDIVKIAPLFAFAGFIMANFVKGKQRVKFIGTALLGLGILFMGMNIMSDSMKPLRESQVFIDLITKLHNPILGILAGVTITGIIQSS